jgi:hypothetical protein
MKIISTNRLFAFVSLISALVFFNSCGEEFNYGSSNHAVQTLDVTNITKTSASIDVSVIFDGGHVIKQRGLCWSTSENPTIINSKIVDPKTIIGNFSCSLSGLTPGTVYYARAYSINGVGTAYGNQVSFTTNQATLPILNTTKVTGITISNATSGGNITSDGGTVILSQGVCWSKVVNPTITDNKTKDYPDQQGVFTSLMYALELNTVYYVRAYATNKVGTAYGNEITFKTKNLAIGDDYQGGIIGYMLVSGDLGYIQGEVHGLIITSTNISSSAQWGCVGTLIQGANGIAIGTGNLNTLQIINGCNQAGTAARLCYNLVLNGYSDWYLPSINELDAIYQYSPNTLGGGLHYWSSTQSDIDHSRFTNFGVIGISGFLKNGSFYVRAVRSF